MFSVVRENEIRRMFRAGVLGGVAFTFLGYCLLTGDDDVLRGRGSRATRAARADYDHDPHHHHDGCLSVPSAVVAHDGLEAFIRIASSGQVSPDLATALLAETVAVPVPQPSSDSVPTIAVSSAKSQTLVPFHGRAPPEA